ncbi:prolyl oligopeptidase family serine peptidase [Aliifodinibius salicampi]|uniref:Prolyl oligopeptidase family serine peptidase n=1 Tax=Fodinibius salicampi TaxID=1920655 RepID=A0ABT3PZ54_9BACT|nr:prolyl oligopeptidase family serine peptidase [Fodinibius salicampi]MCW9713127.1 prolyl oligopeptidase family serine peptidase [Fodinibius salicampi]
MRHFRLAILLISCFLLSISTLSAQKQKLEPKDYGQWQRIGGTELSPDGEWFSYNISLEDGDGWLIIKEVGADTTAEHKFMHGVRPDFSNDNKWAAFLIGVSEDEQKKLEEQNKSVRYKLGLMNLATTQVDTFKNVQSFEFSNNGHHLLMRKYKPEESNTDGADVIIRNLRQGTNQLVGNVSEYEFNKKGDKLALLLDATEDFGNGAHLYDLASNRINILDSDTTNYKELSWNKEGTAVAFLKELEKEDFKDPTHLVYAFRNLNQSPQKQIFDQQEFQTFPDSFRVVDYQEPRWSDDGGTLFMGIKEWEKDPEEAPKKSDADSTAKKNDDDDLDPSNVEVWHWKDADIQPRQEVMADAERRSNYLSAWHLDDDKFVQLGAENREQLQLTGDQKHVVAYNPKPYEPAFEEDWREVYVLDVATGEEKKILDRHEFVRTSPDGQYLLYFKDKNWWTYDISEDTHTNITGDIDSRFENFTRVNGREYRRPFGSGDWAEDDQWVLIYDRYDTYKVWTDGSNYNRLTEGASDRIRFRYTSIDYGDDQDGIKDDQPIFFSMYGDTTKKRGYARYTDGNLETLIYEDQMYNRFSRADSTDRFVYQMQSATDSPDMFLVDNSFDDPVTLTFTNPQQEDYYWADDELITFTNERGDQLEGRLLYPANYEPGETYPMVTYIYEKRSQTMHSYSMPSRKSPYNFRRFSSEGYFVFQPDINYELRDPGVSAVESVVPAVEKVIDTGMINEDQIGLTGHSWGAYQTTFIITQTNLFNSAVAGAPLTNMISMYNSIYWNSGMTDAKIFEVSQGRFPDPWWEDWDNFVDNSPIFNMEGVNTPLLVEFGTDDGAVDFNQGVELYNTMRRMQNPFVMLVYEGENHGLAREENQIDYATRAFEWHEHYLLGKEPADWITEGLPYLERPAIQEEEQE